jgi:hypothetical protein
MVHIKQLMPASIFVVTLFFKGRVTIQNLYETSYQVVKCSYPGTVSER